MKTIGKWTGAGLALAACAALALVIAPVPGLAADQVASIKTVSLSKPLTERDLDDSAWARVPAQEVALANAFAGHVAITGTAAISKVTVQAAKTAAGVLFRLKWKDPAPDSVKAEGRFPDGVAVQFALDRKTSTIPFMGGDGKLVNIWYWSAARNGAENMVADGFGTTTPLKTQDVRAYGRHADGEWTVAFFRAYRSEDEAAIKLAAKGGRYPVAFAVWQGANQERDGLKAVTLAWQSLGL